MTDNLSAVVDRAHKSLEDDPRSRSRLWRKITITALSLLLAGVSVLNQYAIRKTNEHEGCYQKMLGYIPSDPDDRGISHVVLVLSSNGWYFESGYTGSRTECTGSQLFRTPQKGNYDQMLVRAKSYTERVIASEDKGEPGFYCRSCDRGKGHRDIVVVHDE